jgi:predicted transcriptional regulator
MLLIPSKDYAFESYRFLSAGGLCVPDKRSAERGRDQRDKENSRFNSRHTFVSCLFERTLLALAAPVKTISVCRTVLEMATIFLTVPLRTSKLTDMVVRLKPETESRLQELAATTGRAPDELVEEAMAGYLAELAQARKMLDGRYDEITSGQVEPIEGEEAFNRLRRKSKDRRHP